MNKDKENYKRQRKINEESKFNTIALGKIRVAFGNCYIYPVIFMKVYCYAIT